MSCFAITVENIAKAYTIRQTQQMGNTRQARLNEDIGRWLTAPLRRLSRHARHNADACTRDSNRNNTPENASANGIPAVSGGMETFWALRDINFNVEPGETLGIVGHNGAGKSTLLKILSRITSPTRGRISARGRMTSLLEVGTGFHPELSGRENIYLNGTILGMSRSEIRSQFDAIVAFSGVEKFLETPVKRYSSGMSVRLAFAVASHLQSEILVLDEVLMVGDSGFQQKCLQKISEVTREDGRTVLIVSHVPAVIGPLCSRIIELRGGTIHADTTDVAAALADYEKAVTAQAGLGGKCAATTATADARNR